jgi:hypothetical protein
LFFAGKDEQRGFQIETVFHAVGVEVLLQLPVLYKLCVKKSVIAGEA